MTPVNLVPLVIPKQSFESALLSPGRVKPREYIFKETIKTKKWLKQGRFFVASRELELVIRFDISCANYFFPFEFLSPGDSNNVALVNESINFLKSSLEKTENGFIKIRDNRATENRVQGTPGKATNNGTHLNHSAANIKDEAAMHMLLACKRNVILYDFFRIGMFSLAANKQPSSEKHLGLLIIFSCMYISTVEFQGLVHTTPEEFKTAA